MAQCDIDAPSLQVDQLRGSLHAHLDMRMQRIESGQARHQPAGGERGLGTDGQGTGAHQRVQVQQRALDLAEATREARVQRRSRLGELHAMAAAGQQADAKTVLQLADLLADRPRRHPHALGSGLQAAQASGFGKSAQGEQWQDSAHGESLI